MGFATQKTSLHTLTLLIICLLISNHIFLVISIETTIFLKKVA